MTEYVRVLRLLEYVGTSEWVQSSLDSQRAVKGEFRTKHGVIRESTLPMFPEVLNIDEPNDNWMLPRSDYTRCSEIIRDLEETAADTPIDDRADRVNALANEAQSIIDRHYKEGQRQQDRQEKLRKQGLREDTVVRHVDAWDGIWETDDEQEHQPRENPSPGAKKILGGETRDATPPTDEDPS